MICQAFLRSQKFPITNIVRFIIIAIISIKKAQNLVVSFRFRLDIITNIVHPVVPTRIKFLKKGIQAKPLL